MLTHIKRYTTMETTNDIQLQVLTILDSKFKGTEFVYGVNVGKWCLGGGEYLKIFVACSDIDINGCKGQKPQIVSLSLDLVSMELEPVAFGGNGGRNIYRKPNLQDASEKHLAMKNIKIPFTKPKKELKFVLSAINRFFDNYIKVLKENKEVLTDSNLVNYESLLSKV
jgi:hypothetical protein